MALDDRDTNGGREPGCFVVVSEARSGSSYLTGGLNSHPNITCHGEVYHPESILGRVGLEGLDVATRDADPVGFLSVIRRLTAAHSEAKMIGFKLHFRHRPIVLEAILDDPDWRVIFLRRRDKLSQWGSYQLALKTGLWGISAESPWPVSMVTRIPFRLRAFFAYLLHQHHWEQLVLTRRADCLAIWYEDLVGTNGFRPVFDFLGVDPEVPVQSERVKQFVGKSRYERFTNPIWARMGAFAAQGMAAIVRGTRLQAVVCRRFRY